MLNWVSIPSFVAMLLFSLLAAYILTRSPRRPSSAMAVGANLCGAVYLLGQGMQANALSLDEWVPWIRNVQWGAILAPTLWYWLTVLLLREQAGSWVRGYLRWFGYPLGILFGIGSLIFTVGNYADGWLLQWSQAEVRRAVDEFFPTFVLPQGPLYAGYVLFIAATTAGAVGNIFLCWCVATGPELRARFGWLLLSATLFFIGSNMLGGINWYFGDVTPTWIAHSLILIAMVVMAWNVAAYSLFFEGQVMVRDFCYFVVASAAICALLVLLLVLMRPAFSFQLLQVAAVSAILAVLAPPLVDLTRRVLDHLFFSREVQHLRQSLASVVEEAALTPDVEAVLAKAQSELEEVSTEHVAELVEDALRKLNNPGALAESPLVHHVPHSVATHGQRNEPDIGRLSPLELARALRELLSGAIEGLKPGEGDHPAGSPAALQYSILYEEYLLGRLNKQIMTRHSIGEGTFNRHRRQAVWTLARELENNEARLAQRAAGTVAS